MNFAFVVFATSLIIVGAIIWILNIEDVIKGPWSSILGVIFTVLSAVLTLLQWHLQTTLRMLPTSVASPVQATKENQQGHSTQIEDIVPRVNRHKGALIVYTKKNMRGATINLNYGFDVVSSKTHLASNVVERKRNSHIVFVGTFPSLDPGNYTAHTSLRQLVAKVTVLPGQITEIDWR